MEASQAVNLIYGLMGYSALLTLLLILMLAWTPAATFFKARLIGGYVLFTKLKGLRMMDIRVGKLYGRGAIKTKGATYFISKESGILIKKGKIGAYIVPAGIASTTNMDAFGIFDTLEKETGMMIDSYEKYVEALKKYASLHPDKQIHIPAYRSVKFRDLDEIFSRNVNTDLQEAAFALERKKASLMDKFSMTHAMMIFIILVGVGLAAVFINMAFGDKTPCNCQCLLDTALNATRAIGGGTITG